MKKALGRVYPAAIQTAIEKLGLGIDALVSPAIDLSISEGTDAQRALSALNARLVNEVIIVVSQVTDDEARVRLAAIEKDTAILGKKISEKASIHKDAVRIFSKPQAEALVSGWGRAFEVYDDMIKRLGRLKASAMSTEAYSDVTLSLQMLDTDVLWTKDAFEQLATLAAGRDDVEVEGGTFSRMAGWLAEALVTDNKLRRLEGTLESKPARPIPSVSAQSPWISIIGVTAGLGGIGMVLFMSTKE